MSARLLYVSVKVEPMFQEWLDGKKPDTICPEWPVPFTIRRAPEHDKPLSIFDSGGEIAVLGYIIESPVWDEDDLSGLWTPLFHVNHGHGFHSPSDAKN